MSSHKIKFTLCSHINHFRFNYNFGMLGLLDRVHGTDSLFRRSPQGSRHLMLLSFIPAHEQFPEKPKKSS